MRRKFSRKSKILGKYSRPGILVRWEQDHGRSNSVQKDGEIFNMGEVCDIHMEHQYR